VLLRELPRNGLSTSWSDPAYKAYAKPHPLSAAYVASELPPNSLEYSEDGRYLLSAWPDGAVYLFDTVDRRSDATMLAPADGGRRSARFGSKGNGAITWDDTGGLYVHDWGSKPVELIGASSPPTTAALSRSGTWAAAGFTDGSVWIWWATGEHSALMVHEFSSAVAHLEFNRDSSLFVATSVDGRARVFHPHGQLRHKLGGDANTRFAHFGEGAERVLTGGSDGKVRIWEMESPDPVRTFPASESKLLDASFSDSDSKVVIASTDEGLGVFYTKSGATSSRVETKNPVRDVSFAPGGRTALIVDSEGLAQQWSPDGANRYPPVQVGPHGAKVLAVAPSRVFATATPSGVVQIWDPRSTTGPRALTGHEGTVHFVGYGDGGRTVLTAATDGLARVWRGEPLELVRTFGTPGEQIRLALVLPDERGFLTVSGEAKLRFAPRSTTENVVRLPASGERVTAIAADHTGFRFVTAHDDGSLALRRLGALDESTELVPHRVAVSALAVSPNGHFILSGASDGSLAWSLADGSHSSAFLQGHEAKITTIRFSETGEIFATGSDDGVVVLWKVDDNPKSIQRHELGAAASILRFDPDARYLLGVGGDGCTQVWQTGDSGRPWPRWCSNSGIVRFADFDQYSESLILATENESVLRVSLVGTAASFLPDHVGGVTAMTAFWGHPERFVTASGEGSVRSWNVGNLREDLWRIEYCTPPKLRQAQLGETATVSKRNFERCLDVVEACRPNSGRPCMSAVEQAFR
jgi:WD40 repeat protein